MAGREYLDASAPLPSPATSVFRFEPASRMGDFHFYEHPGARGFLVKCQLTPPPGLPDAFLGISLFDGVAWLDLWPLSSIPSGRWLQLRDRAGTPLPLAIYRRDDAMFGEWL